MSIYAQAVVSGGSAAQLALTGENAQTRAAYNATLNFETRKLNLLSAKNRSEKNISAIRQDKILSELNIEQNRAQAEAMAKLSAAVAGVSGNSVDDVYYGIDSNAARRNVELNRRENQATETELANIYSNESAILSAQEPKVDAFGDLLTAFSSLRPSDFQIGAANA